MYLQIVIFILSILGLYIFKEKGPNGANLMRKKYIQFVMFLFVLQSGLRNVAVGSDTFNYYNHFIKAKNESWGVLWTNFLSNFRGEDIKDPGYALLQKAFSTVFPSYRIYLIFIAIGAFYMLGKLIFRYTESNKDVLVCVSLYQCLYYSFFSITGLRQTVATIFLFCAIQYAIDRKLLKYLLFVFFAYTQHKSALLFLPFYFFPLLKNTRSSLIIAFVSYVPMLLWGTLIAKYFVEDTIFNQYQSYLNQNEDAGAYSFNLYILLMGVLSLIYRKKIESYHPHNYIMLNSLAMAIFLTPLTMIDPSNMRIVQYYSIFSLFILPNILRAIVFTIGKDIHILVFVLLSFYTISMKMPYAFFWQDMVLGTNYGYNIIVNDSLIE